MFIERFKNNGILYLRLAESVYTPGVKGGRKKIICNLGAYSKYDDGLPDFYERLKHSVKIGKPIIPEIAKYFNVEPMKPDTYTCTVKRGDPILIGKPRLFSHVLIERILEDFGLSNFFSQYKSFNNLSYDLVSFFRLLVYGRILKPTSKLKTMAQNNMYYEKILDDDAYIYNVYDTLDFIYQYKNNILQKINKSLIKNSKRTTKCIYYDCTNFFFEIENPDETIRDENDEVIYRGLRQMGVCKEERKLPIVQMGLFIDEQGIPISINTFPGNTLDHLTVPTSLKTLDNFNYDKFIFIGDRGMYRGNNTAYIVNNKHGYIISKSIEKTKKDERDWIYNQDGYIYEGKSFKYKSRTYKRDVTLEDGKKQEIVEKVVVYWSKKFADKQIAENKSFLEFIEKLKANPNNFKISKTQSKSLKRFIKNECLNDLTGEILDSSKIIMMLDDDKINAYQESFGYYQIVTSELDMPDKEIIDKYHGLSRIEDQFRIMKGTLDTRPLYVWTDEHIEAHLILCTIALVVMRIIQNKIVEFKGEDQTKNWTSGLTGERVQEALNKWKVELFNDGYYRFCDIDDPDLKLILDSFGINIIPDLYSKADLKEIKKNIKIFK